MDIKKWASARLGGIYKARSLEQLKASARGEGLADPRWGKKLVDDAKADAAAETDPERKALMLKIAKLLEQRWNAHQANK